ncbi:MAG: sigma 54-interacting transcriptional regulator [Vicinamibacterales bacterium]
MSSSSLQALLARADLVLERGRGADAVQLLAPALRAGTATRDEELALRVALARAWLLQDDLEQAATALGRTPDAFRDTISASRLSALWRMHGRLASARGDQSRAIALHGRALKCAEAAHDSHAIGLAHYELGHCYRQVGDVATVREHMSKAASALLAAGDRRHLALVHSLSSISLAQVGRFDEAMTALQQAEHLAERVRADDVVATVCGNQANVQMFEHRYDKALALAERSVSLHEGLGSGHGLAVALATLGQICVRLGDLTRAEQALNRALAVRSPIQFHETTGAVFDTLTQIHMIRGRYDLASECLGRAGDEYGAYGKQTSRWYEWSVKVLNARLALKRGAVDEAVALATAICTANAPPLYVLQARLIAAEALASSDKLADAEAQLSAAANGLDPRAEPGTWAEYLRIRGSLHEQRGAATEAYHDFAQSATLLDLLGERYQTALSQLAIGRLIARTGARTTAERHLDRASAVFAKLGAERDLNDTRAARDLLTAVGTGEDIVASVEADDAVVRRIVEAAALPELLGRETTAAMLETSSADAAVLFVETNDGGRRVIASAGCDSAAAADLIRTAESRRDRRGLFQDALGRDAAGPRVVLVVSPRPLGGFMIRRLRTIAAVARQGYALCAALDRSDQTAAGPLIDQALEPLLPGFLSASAAMGRVTEQIQRMQGNDLPVLITGESGTGKELVSRAIHVGSHRSSATFLPYNCTTTGRDLADSQLFGHRRGAFTGAVHDSPGLIRTAAGGTLFLDEIGDLTLDVQPKLLRFLEQSEIMPVGDTRPQLVDVRVIAATNADLEQRVAEGKFREDLYYRLSVIRIHVPPLRERREEIPHLTAFFLREVSERLAKPGVSLSSDALDAFSQYWWPGNVRQLKNEVQRAVALSLPGGVVEASHLSPEIVATHATGTAGDSRPGRRQSVQPQQLGAAVDQLEREIIQSTLDRTGGNVSESARVLGITRRGLYLKLRRLGLESALGE